MSLFVKSTDVAKILLESNCLKLSPENPFTYASGLKGPIYCDNRLLLGNPVARKAICSFLKDFINEKITERNWDVHGILGMATGAIAMGAWVSNDLDLPFGYIRSSAKGHGKGKLVEGISAFKGSYLVVEDLVNQGSSLKKGLSTLTKDIDFGGCFCIVNYGFPKAKENLEELGIDLFSLTNFESLIQAGIELGSLNHKSVEALKTWHQDPENWVST